MAYVCDHKPFILYCMGEFMKLIEGRFYFLKDDYLKFHKDSKLMSTRKVKNFRPFLLVNDPERPDIKWMIPISSNVKKYKRIKNADNKKLIQFHKTSAFGERAFLIQNACPCLSRDILKEYQTRDGKSIILGKKELNSLLKQTKLMVHLLNAGIDIGYVSKNTYKEILKPYINQRLISSKKFALLGIESIKKGNTQSLNGYIIQKDNKRFEVKRALLNDSNTNIDLVLKRGNQKIFVEDAIQNKDLKIEEDNDLISNQIMQSESSGMEMD